MQGFFVAALVTLNSSLAYVTNVDKAGKQIWGSTAPCVVACAVPNEIVWRWERVVMGACLGAWWQPPGVLCH